MKGESNMAFINKVTFMQRCAIINCYNGDIEWEGVNIEGTFVLKDVFTNAVATIGEERINYFLDDCNTNGDCILVYMDKYDEKWIPRDDESVIQDVNGKYTYKEEY